jgi:DNA-binding PadR family transcriptional regulator
VMINPSERKRVQTSRDGLRYVGLMHDWQHGWKGAGRGGWPPPPWAFPWRSGGPRVRRGNVRAAILTLLLERPMHGYEMMQELESRTDGVWRPSAGSIYPTLQMLEDEGLVKSEEIGDRRRYSLTDVGRAQAQSRSGPPPWEFTRSGEAPGSQLREAGFQVAAAVMQAAATGSDEQVAKVRDILADTRRRIYAVLGDEPER